MISSKINKYLAFPCNRRSLNVNNNAGYAKSSFASQTGYSYCRSINKRLLELNFCVFLYLNSKFNVDE